MLVEHSVDVIVVRRGLGAFQKPVCAIGGFSWASGARWEGADRGKNLLRKCNTLVGGPRRDLPEDILVVGRDAHTATA